MKKLAEGYDDQALEWKSHAEQTEVQPEYILVGDNIDKNITPRQMLVDNQVKSLHYFRLMIEYSSAIYRVKEL